MFRPMQAALLGGDEREVILGEALVRENLKVWHVGFEAYPYPERIAKKELDRALSLSRIIIAPLSGIDASGGIAAPYSTRQLSLRRASLSLIRKGSLLLAGSLPGAMKEELRRKGVVVMETAGRDDVACGNAIPTAEGAIQYAMEESQRVLHGSQSLVAGFGRCGKALAYRLLHLGSSVTVGTRNPASLAEAEIFGFLGMPLADLRKEMPRFDFIFNTVPSMLFTAPVLKAARDGAVIIDIASSPGGVDLEAGKKRGIRVRAIPGIPGKRAPVTSGEILSKIYVPLIKEHLEGNRGGEEHEV